MSPPKRDELLTMLVAKLDQLDGTVAKFRESLARIEAGQEQAKEARAQWNSHEWPAHLKLHADGLLAHAMVHETQGNALDKREGRTQERLTSLEETRSQARGAATMLRVLWIVGPIVGGTLASVVAHYSGMLK